MMPVSVRNGAASRFSSASFLGSFQFVSYLATLALVCALCYYNSLRGEFVHDDVWAILNNPDVRSTAPLSNIFSNDFWGKSMAENTSHKSYRPLCILTFKLNIMLTDTNPFYFHLFNVILHSLVTCLLMYTCDRMVFQDSWLAFVTALIFAVHPIHTEAVTGIVGRADVLACLLFLLAFLSYNRSVDLFFVGEYFPSTTSPLFLLLSLLLGTCAMLVKETGITVFGVCVLYDLFILCHKKNQIEKLCQLICAFLETPAPMDWQYLQIHGCNHRFGSRGQGLTCSPLQDVLISCWSMQRDLLHVQLLNGGSLARWLNPPSQSWGLPFWISSSVILMTDASMYGWDDLCMDSPVQDWYLMITNSQKYLYTAKPFLKRAALMLCYVILILYLRLQIMGGSMPLFSEQDNPASFSPYILTRFLTYSYLLAFNAWLLLAPITQCYDWQVGSIPLVDSFWDTRNLASLLLFLVKMLLCLHCLMASKKMEHKEILVGLLFLVLPFIPASNLFFRVGFVVAERVLYMPSMGYCILIVHGMNKLCTWLGKWGAAALTVSTLLLLLLFSLKTVKQNEIWLSRESLFRSGVQTLPHNAKVHYNYANFLKDQGSNEEAIYHYKTALLLYPRHASALNNLGTLTKDMTEAEDYYRRALQLNPQHNRALFNLGNLLRSQGKKDEAVLLLTESVKFGPQFADAYSSLASLLAEQESFNEAEEVYHNGIENCPENPDLHNNYGVFLVDTGVPEKATAHYLKAINLRPNHYVAMANLGRLYRSLGQNKEAETWYKRALKITRNSEILSPLGALYYNTGRYKEALKIYRESVTLQPSNKEILLALAQVLAIMGETNEAEKMTNRIAAEEKGCLECYRLLSAIYNKQKNYIKALEAIENALQLKPKDPKVISELYFSKGNQLREQNLLEQAFESYKVAVDLNPDQAQAWMNMGGIEHMKGNYIFARDYYEKALLLVPSNKLLKENLAKLDRLEKQLQEVQEISQT
uniref:dolichyl-phosphate-mannose--protein mannosyltransferase n=1 Tax=Geotrypetes seraphini TaxID=260995 RepID=A0A6P8RV83_GEOSA|nr:protein O-mannosyl-transferase TMTC1 [Geotrypetes seraphini]